ncbi:MAG: nicotinate-nucleotide adenylyltransferase [Malacoplasma sp.]|nr:nicotinate-nucleotide adenylyltransferase [Malacoplasma sp.]MDE5774834.1 nicotinate-nucleotide adenylyltransferase [Malacoplasma sp.]MDE7099702.1 nicotinate-nucleotide adenylyltransferase [Malacoplasma sp.]
MKVNKLIIFGGSFDPVHNGHLKIAKKAFKKIKADKLFFVPCNQHPDAKNISASNSERLAMLNLAIQNIPEFEICEFELNNNEPSYTINTVRYFKQNYTNYELYLLVGYDQLVHFKEWQNYQEILENVKIICHVRKIDKSLIKQNVDFPYIKVGLKNINAASSQLKTEPKKAFLNPKVLNYINENAIYVEDREKLVLTEYRLNHCKVVANIAKDLALSHKLYPIVKKAYVAGWYHDYAKDMPKEKLEEIAKKIKIKDYVSWKVLHGHVAAYIMEKDFFMDDYQVLTAIRSHTLPFDFSSLSKIVYIADKLAPRDDEANQLRKEWAKLAFKDLNLCFETIKDFYDDFYSRKGKEKLES